MENCSDLLKGGIFDEFHFDSNTSVSEQLLKKFKSLDENQARNLAKSGVNLSLPIDGFPVSFGASDNTERFNQWKRAVETLDSRQFTSEHFITTFQRIANKDVIDGWLGCIKLKFEGSSDLNGLSIKVEPDGAFIKVEATFKSPGPQARTNSFHSWKVIQLAESQDAPPIVLQPLDGSTPTLISNTGHVIRRTYRRGSIHRDVYILITSDNAPDFSYLVRGEALGPEMRIVTKQFPADAPYDSGARRPQDGPATYYYNDMEPLIVELDQEIAITYGVVARKAVREPRFITGNLLVNGVVVWSSGSITIRDPNDGDTYVDGLRYERATATSVSFRYKVNRGDTIKISGRAGDVDGQSIFAHTLRVLYKAYQR